MAITQPHFLYVEDDPMSRIVTEVLLKEVMGFQTVTIFENSQSFIERLETLSPPPQVILLDIQMRPYDGYEVLEMLRKHPTFQDAIVIALTANVMAHDVEKLKAVGFNGLIGKPIMRDIFPQLITNIIAGDTVWYIP